MKPVTALIIAGMAALMLSGCVYGGYYRDGYYRPYYHPGCGYYHDCWRHW